MDLLTTYTHDSELQVIREQSLISTLYKSLHAKFSPACSVFTSRFPVTDLNSGDSTASELTSLLSGEHPIAELWRHLFSASLEELKWLIAPTVLVATSRHGPYRKHSSSTVGCVSVVAGTCLTSCCPETGCITPFIKNPVPQQRATFRGRYPATGLNATIYGRRNLGSRQFLDNVTRREIITLS
jgi:hypothetical protein